MQIRGQVPFFRLVALTLLATGELALARLALPRIKPADVLRRNALGAALLKAGPPADEAAQRSAEVAAVIARLALRVPWRADCLVQALAGQRLLLRYHVASEIVIGTTKGTDGAFEAHAWLLHEGTVILGGDVARFDRLLDSRANTPKPR